MLRPLLLTGGPAAGKSTTARTLADSTPDAAFVDVDDVRQLVRTGGAAPWDGVRGRAQQLLGVRNACALAANLRGEGFAVTLADVVDTGTLARYRELLPEVLVVRLVVSLSEARRRAATRRVFLTDAEFDMLHRQQSAPLAVEHEVAVDGLGVAEQVERVRMLWHAASCTRTFRARSGTCGMGVPRREARHLA